MTILCVCYDHTVGEWRRGRWTAEEVKILKRNVKAFKKVSEIDYYSLRCVSFFTRPPLMAISVQWTELQDCTTGLTLICFKNASLHALCIIGGCRLPHHMVYTDHATSLLLMITVPIASSSGNEAILYNTHQVVLKHFSPALDATFLTELQQCTMMQRSVCGMSLEW